MRNSIEEVKMQYKLKTILLFLLLVAVLFPLFAHAEGEIVCGGTRYDVPNACLNDCTKKAGFYTACSLASKCPDLKKGNFPVLYNQALFNKGPVAQPLSFQVLASYIINNYYSPLTVKKFQITLDPNTTEAWADIDAQPLKDGRYALKISPDAFLLSPAFIVSTIGHEMVHYYQYQRKSNLDLNNINRAIGPFRELEASNWDTGKKDFKWENGQNRFYDYLNKNEKDELQSTLRCREWQVKKAIEDIRTMKGPQSLSILERWLKETPWSNQVWLPANPSWKTYVAGLKPVKDCPSP